MIVLIAYMFLGGMTAGLAAFLQADTKGWRVIVGLCLTLLAGFALIINAAWGQADPKALEGDPRVLVGAVITGTMFWALIGAVIGKIFSGRVEPVALGLRTMIVVAVVQLIIVMFGGIG